MSKELTKKTQRQLHQLVSDKGVTGVYDMVLNGELKEFPKGFWSLPESRDYAIDCLKYLFNDILNWTHTEICENYSIRLLSEYELGGARSKLFNNSVSDMLTTAYPNEFKPWELKNVATSFWTFENRVEVVRWLFTEKYPYSKEFVLENYRRDFFKDNGIRKCWNSENVFKLLDTAFPNTFKEWELLYTPRGCDSESIDICSIKWLFTERYPFDHEFVVNNCKDKFLQQHGLRRTLFRNNTFELLNKAFPNEFHKSEFNKPSPTWTLESEIATVQKLIEENKWSEEEIYKNFSSVFLLKNGVLALARKYESVFTVLEHAYPGKFDYNKWKSYHTNRK